MSAAHAAHVGHVGHVGRTGGVRAVGAVTALWGAALLARPEAVSRAVTAGSGMPPEPVVRVLGARVLAQSAAELGWPGRRSATASAAVDTLHAASMVALAAVSERYRRVALASAGVAAGSALLALAAGRRAAPALSTRLGRGAA